MPSEVKALDGVDLHILGILVADGRITFADLADRVGLSGPSTAERVRRLQDRGAIRGFAARIDPASLGLGLTAFVAVTLGDPSTRTGFLAAVSAYPEVVECHHLAGEDDYLLKVHADGTRGLESLVTDRLKSLPGVARTRTTVVLSSPLERPLAPGG